MLIAVTMLAAAVQAAPTVSPPLTNDPVVCVRQKIGDEVGTRLQSKKVCMKKSEWAAMQKINDQAVGHAINDGNDRMRFIPINNRPE